MTSRRVPTTYPTPFVPRSVRMGARLIAVMATIALMALSALLYLALLYNEHWQIDRAHAVLAANLAQRINTDLDMRRRALERMARRWEVDAVRTRPDWESDAKSYLQDNVGYQALEWVDPSGTVRWVVPLKGNAKAVGLDLERDPVRRRALQQARETRQVAISGPVSLAQGGRGMLVVRALFPHQRFDGYLTAVYRLDDIFAALLPETLPVGVLIEVLHQEDVVYQRESTGYSAASAEGAKTESLSALPGWSLRATVNRAFHNAYHSNLPEFALLGGLVVSLLVGGLLGFWQLADQRAEREAEAAAALRASEQRLQLALDGSGASLWDFDVASGEVFLDERWARLLGGHSGVARINIESLAALVHPDDRAVLRATLTDVLKGVLPEYRVEHRVCRPDGSWLWVQSTGKVTERDANGLALRMTGTNIDITDHRADLDRLHVSNERIRTILETVVDGIITIDETGQIESFNPAAERIFGYDAHEVIGRNVNTLIPELNDSAHGGYLAKYLRSGERDIIGYGRETQGRRKDGSLFSLDLAVSETRLGGRRIFTGLVRDITARKRSEDALRESEERLRYMLETSPIAARIASDGGRKVIFSNRRYAALINVDPAASAGRDPGSYYANVTDYNEILARLDRGETIFDRLIELRIPDAGTKWVLASYLPITYGGEPAVLGWFYDITAHKRAEQQLGETRSFLATILDSLPAMLFVKDARELRFVMFNRAGEDLLGLRREYMIGKNDYDFFPKDQADFFTARDRDVLNRRVRLDIPEEPISTPKGERWLHTIKVPVLGADGEPAYLLGISTDITEARLAQADLQRAHAKNQSILDAIPDLMLQLDEHGRFIDYHAISTQELAFPPESFMGRTVEEVMPPALAARTLDAVRKVGETDETEIFEYSLPNRLGVSQDWEARFARVATGGTLIIIRNITDRKKIERMQSEFISVVSHELRTPLTSIRGSLGLLAGGAVHADEAKRKNLVDIAHQNVERLSVLINDILDVEKIASGRMKFDIRPQPLMPLVEQAIDMNQAYAAQYDVVLRLIETIERGDVSVDAQRFQQVMANLLSNAIKFSPAGAVVEIRVAARERVFRVSVADRGPGVPADFHDRIFERFSQADTSTTRAKSGTGLGLAISREIVERLQGRIGFENRDGSGAVFWVELPIALRQSRSSRRAREK